MRRIQIAITLGAVAIAAAHLVWPAIEIDATTLVLFTIAVIPWLAPLFKSVEFPGGWKIEFQELENARGKAEAAGLLDLTTKRGESEFSFQAVAEEDPNLALAGLRIEIESRLRELARTRNVPSDRAGIGQLLHRLDRHDILNPEERAALSEMVHLLNSAVHGAKVDSRAAQWALEVGPQLLAGIDERIERTHAEENSQTSDSNAPGLNGRVRC